MSRLTLKGVIHVATKDEFLNAARVKPSNRTPAERALVERGKSMQDVRNADFEAQRQERIYGK